MYIGYWYRFESHLKGKTRFRVSRLLPSLARSQQVLQVSALALQNEREPNLLEVLDGAVDHHNGDRPPLLPDGSLERLNGDRLVLVDGDCGDLSFK